LFICSLVLGQNARRLAEGAASMRVDACKNKMQLNKDAPNKQLRNQPTKQNLSQPTNQASKQADKQASKKELS
jgi:hypothetical protein